MKIKRTKIRISLLLLLSSLLAALPFMAGAFYAVNGGGEILELEPGQAYVAGSEGMEQVEQERVYVLGAEGLSELGPEAPEESLSPPVETSPPEETAAPEETPPTETPPTETTRPADSFTGGGGLRYLDGSVAVSSKIVMVGLRYYYSERRDTALEQANLENAVGSGYAFGVFDKNRQFQQLASTTETKITMRVTKGSGIGVYITGTDNLLYEKANTGADSMLAVCPLSDSGDAVTWFKGFQYYGAFGYAMLGGGKVTVTNVLDTERYVMGVCAAEMGESFPLEALKAQAVAARTYAGKAIQKSPYYYACGFDLTADTYSQAYLGCGAVGEKITRAAWETENQYLTYEGVLCDALYSSSDGGATEDNRNVNGGNAHPYLAGVIDPYEAAVAEINPYSSWTRTYSPAFLGLKVGLPEVASVMPSYSETGNLIALRLVSPAGAQAEVLRGNCRTTLDLPSIHCTVAKNQAGQFVFTGSGWGHSLGMSQYGAYAMAAVYDKNYQDILGFYYTGVGLSYGVT